MTLRIGDKSAKHTYDVEVSAANGKVLKIEVDADTRTKAGKVARDAGYVVRSMNMVG